jgi:hypothetical protein
VVEGTGLENRRRRESPVGSNPTPSARISNDESLDAIPLCWPARARGNSPQLHEGRRRVDNAARELIGHFVQSITTDANKNHGRTS